MNEPGNRRFRSALKTCLGRMLVCCTREYIALQRRIQLQKKRQPFLGYSNVVKDTCHRLDTETARSRRYSSCANRSCDHFLAILLINRNDLVEDVSTSGSGSSRCHDRPERTGRDRPRWGSRRPPRSGFSDADIDPIEGLVVVFPSPPMGCADSESQGNLRSNQRLTDAGTHIRTSQCRHLKNPPRRRLHHPGVK